MSLYYFVRINVTLWTYLVQNFNRNISYSGYMYGEMDEIKRRDHHLSELSVLAAVSLMKTGTHVDLYLFEG